MVAKGGHSLLNNDSVESLKKKLFPKSFLITPNLPEAEKILDIKIKNDKDMENNIEMFNDIKVNNVLIKGGHLNGNKVTDLLLNNGKVYKFMSDKIKTGNTHGTGCSLSSAIATYFSCGKKIKKSCELGIKYVNEAINNNVNYGKGHGPINHLVSFDLKRGFN